MGTSIVHTPLLGAAYADSTWSKIISALNSFELFEIYHMTTYQWPLSQEVIAKFIQWAAFVKNLSPNSIVAYVSHLKLIHKLRCLNHSSCECFLTKTLIRGAQNLMFYSQANYNVKKVMTLPLLKLLGHEISKSNWSDLSKSVLWCAVTTAFFGSFRFGELLAKNESSFNPYETMLWSDIKFIDLTSVRIHNKIPKNRTAGGEYISLFLFPDHNCCPIQAIARLRIISGVSAT